MQEKDLKPSTKQRLIFALVAIILLGSSIAAYALIVMGSGNVNYSKMTLTQLETAYNNKSAELDEESAVLSEKYFDEFKQYKKNVKAYNSTTANSNGVQTKDLKEGDGEVIGESGYSAYYIGWCSNEKVFESSLDNYDEPTALKTPMVVTGGSLIEGWYLGTEGMKIGGIREITVPSSLAYADSTEPCGTANSPLKFIVMAIETPERLQQLDDELNEIYNALANAYTKTYSDYDYSDEDYYDNEGETSEE